MKAHCGNAFYPKTGECSCQYCDGYRYGEEVGQANERERCIALLATFPCDDPACGVAACEVVRGFINDIRAGAMTEEPRR